MKKFKFGDIISIPANTLVTVIFNNITITGKVVGKATANLTQSHIIKCCDGQLPNKDYTYDTFVAPLHSINIIE